MTFAAGRLELGDMTPTQEERQRVLLVELRRALIETDSMAWKKKARIEWIGKIERVLP